MVRPLSLAVTLRIFLSHSLPARSGSLPVDHLEMVEWGEAEGVFGGGDLWDT